MKLRQFLIAAMAFAAAVPLLAAEPVYETTTIDNAGADSISGGGRWAIVADQTSDSGNNCPQYIYELDFATMSWEVNAPQIIAAILTGTCDPNRYGESSSLSGQVGAVGVPGFDGGGLTLCTAVADGGAISVITETAGTWAKLGTGQLCGLGTILLPPAPYRQIGGEFGHSVSVGQVSGNQYLIAASAHLYDNGLGADAGVVLLYSYTLGGGPPVMFEPIEGPSAGALFGFSVTVSYPYVLVGAPGVETAYLYEVDGGLTTATLSETLTAGPGLGAEVSLSVGDDLGFSSGMILVSGADASYAWDFSMVDDVVGTLMGAPVKTVAGTFGGDVSQSNRMAAFGRATGVNDGLVYRNLINNDVVATDGVLADVTTDFGGDDLGDVGIDIRLVDEFLFFANTNTPAGVGGGRAIIYSYPCSFGKWIEEGEWNMISFPCDVDGLTFNAVLGQALSGTYEIWGVDDANTGGGAGPDPYEKFDPLVDTIDQNRAYWLRLNSGGDQYLAIPDTVAPLPSFTVTEGPNVNSPANVHRVRTFDLPEPTSDGLGGFRSQIMAANPYSRNFAWADIQYAEGVGGGVALNADLTKVFPTVYVWRPQSGGGYDYDAITDATPGFEGEVQPFEGFFLKLESATLGLDPKLLLPLAE